MVWLIYYNLGQPEFVSYGTTYVYVFLVSLPCGINVEREVIHKNTCD